MQKVMGRVGKMDKSQMKKMMAELGAEVNWKLTIDKWQNNLQVTIDKWQLEKAYWE